jgi:UDP-glucose 4-epimerase
MKKNKIIVTGGAGFIGSNLIEKLLSSTKYKIISLDNYSTGLKNNHIKHKRVKYIKGHTKNFNQIFSKIKKKIEIVFHFGEFSRIAQSFKEKNIVYETNLIGTSEVVNFCSDNNIKIIYSATSASFGNNLQDQHLSPYAFTKTNNLQMILNFNKWFNLKYEIIYFYNVYGPREIINSKMAAVIGIFRDYKKKKLPLPVVKPGTQLRNFTHVEDTINACIFAMKKNKNTQYSVSFGRAYSINEVARMFNHKTKFISSRRGERFKSTKINKLHGQKINVFKARIDLKNYIKDLYKNKK